MGDITLRDVLIDELADSLGADRQLLDAWPALEAAVTAPLLKKFCAEGTDYTRERIRRLEAVFALLGVPATANSSEAMAGLIENALDLAEEGEAGAVRDAAILAAIQKLSHYGHASYLSIAGIAETLREGEIAKLMRKSFDEKDEAIEEMVAMADDEINPRALKAGG